MLLLLSLPQIHQCTTTEEIKTILRDVQLLENCISKFDDTKWLFRGEKKFALDFQSSSQELETIKKIIFLYYANYRGNWGMGIQSLYANFRYFFDFLENINFPHTVFDDNVLQDFQQSIIASQVKSKHRNHQAVYKWLEIKNYLPNFIQPQYKKIPYMDFKARDESEGYPLIPEQDFFTLKNQSLSIIKNCGEKIVNILKSDNKIEIENIFKEISSAYPYFEFKKKIVDNKKYINAIKPHVVRYFYGVGAIHLLSMLGVRINEISSLRKGCLNKEEKTVQVYITKTNKGSHTLPIVEEAFVVFDYLEKISTLMYGKDNPYLFATNEDIQCVGNFSRRSLTHVIELFCKSLGIKVCTHSFRATIATILAIECKDMGIQIVNYLYAHSSFSMTEKYIKVTKEMAHEVMYRIQKINTFKKDEPIIFLGKTEFEEHLAFIDRKNTDEIKTPWGTCIKPKEHFCKTSELFQRSLHDKNKQ